MCYGLVSVLCCVWSFSCYVADTNSSDKNLIGQLTIVSEYEAMWGDQSSRVLQKGDNGWFKAQCPDNHNILSRWLSNGVTLN